MRAKCNPLETPEIHKTNPPHLNQQEQFTLNLKTSNPITLLTLRHPHIQYKYSSQPPWTREHIPTANQSHTSHHTSCGSNYYIAKTVNSKPTPSPPIINKLMSNASKVDVPLLTCSIILNRFHSTGDSRFSSITEVHNK